MPSEDYTPVVRGALKLKGAGPSGITKKKKKKNPKPSTSTSTSDPSPSATTSTSSAIKKALEEADREELEEEKELRELEERGQDGKTASERAREEMRRKRLHERLAKEGVKTHKERVEELNKYLSGLSEHHDMPRIGPG